MKHGQDNKGFTLGEDTGSGKLEFRPGSSTDRPGSGSNKANESSTDRPGSGSNKASRGTSSRPGSGQGGSPLPGQVEDSESSVGVHFADDEAGKHC